MVRFLLEWYIYMILKIIFYFFSNVPFHMFYVSMRTIEYGFYKNKTVSNTLFHSIPFQALKDGIFRRQSMFFSHFSYQK